MAEFATVSTCLWFESRGEEAARFYVSLLPNSRIEAILRDPRDDRALVVYFVLGGTPYQILNGGPNFTLDEAASISVMTDNQVETDRLWASLTADGGKEVQCGWLKDKFGVSWQIVPKVVPRLFLSEDRAAAGRAFQAMMTMVKIDAAAIEAAYESP